MRQTYVALDIETTGLDSQKDAIIEIGAVKFRDDTVLDTWSTLVNPGRPVPYKIQLLTGIRPQDLLQAPEVTSVVGPLSRFAERHPIVGHNVGFDLSFLVRHGAVSRNRSVDTLPLAGILLPNMPSYGLEALCESLDIQVDTHHRALSDAMATRELFLKLVSRGMQLEMAVLQEINRMAAASDWPLKGFFRDLEQEKARTFFQAGTVQEQLRAKGRWDDVPLNLQLEGEETRQPLRPVDRKQMIDEEELCAFLAPGGLLAEGFPGYEHRPQQIEMLRRVARAFNDGGQLLAEAGTGTGKSLAYLLPAIYFAVSNGRRVVVSTNTINLQDQLYNKDLPDLRNLLPLEFRAALLKGRNNYLCLRKLAVFRRSRSLQAEEVQVLAKIHAWLPSTRTGDAAELSLRRDERAVWRRVQAEYETCLGDRCSYRRKGHCFLYRARHAAETAHIIIVNHALMLADMIVLNRVLPEYQHLVIDEAHHLEGRATEQLGFETSRAQATGLLAGLYQPTRSAQPRGFLPAVLGHFPGSAVDEAIRNQVRDHLNKVQRQVEEARGSGERLFDSLQSLLRDLVPPAQRNASTYDLQIEITSSTRVQPAWSEIEILADDLDQALSEVETGLQVLHSGLSELEDSGIVNYDDLVQDTWSRLELLRRLRRQLYAILNEPQLDNIYWFRIRTQDDGISLHAAPLHVGERLAEGLFAQLETVVLTSATLSTSRDFAYLRERLCLDDADELQVDSPFDYLSSTLLFIPTDMPEPGQANYQNVVSKAVLDLCRATKGRALVLFTSHRQLRSTYYAIARQLEEAKIAVYGQSLDGSRRQLLQRFRSTPRSVLMGTRSFWEGIDVVGPALSCLVIARLPFSVPSDPIFAARSRTFDEPFEQFAVPEAILRFRQGFGRLIRSYADRGVVVVLDKRVISKRYGAAFLESLPECRTLQGSLSELPQTAARWIDGDPAANAITP